MKVEKHAYKLITVKNKDARNAFGKLRVSLDNN